MPTDEFKMRAIYFSKLPCWKGLRLFPSKRYMRSIAAVMWAFRHYVGCHSSCPTFHSHFVHFHVLCMGFYGLCMRCFILRVGLHSLCVGFSATTVAFTKHAFTSVMWAVASSVWSVAATVWAVTASAWDIASAVGTATWRPRHHRSTGLNFSQQQKMEHMFSFWGYTNKSWGTRKDYFNNLCRFEGMCPFEWWNSLL